MSGKRKRGVVSVESGKQVFSPYMDPEFSGADAPALIPHAFAGALRRLPAKE
jgi:hypothetical protein